MASLDQSIRAALINAALAVPGMPPLAQISLENRVFNSTVGVPWARLTVQPASSRPLGVNVATKRHDGLLLVDLFAPANSGVAALDALANAVKTAFAPATRLQSDGVAATIDYAERSRAMEQEAEWLQCSVTVRWHCFSTLN